MTRGFLKELKRRNVLKVAVAYLVSAWLLVQVADLVLDSFAAPDWTMRALLIALAIGFPIALAISWTFEVTGKGVVLETEVDRTIHISDRSGRRIDLILLIIVAIVIVFMGLERFVFSQRQNGTPEMADPAQSSEESLRNWSVPTTASICGRRPTIAAPRIPSRYRRTSRSKSRAR